MQQWFLRQALLLTVLLSQGFSESDSLQSDLRQPRQWAVSAEVGMNSLSSLIGPVVSYYVKPQIAVDVGVGLSGSGIRPGFRGRYLFSMEKTSYFGGLGFKYGIGTLGQEAKVKDAETKAELVLTTGKSAFLDYCLGADYLADNGFLVLAEIGWSSLLTDHPYTLVRGTPSEKGTKALNIAFGSGLMLAVSLGKAF